MKCLVCMPRADELPSSILMRTANRAGMPLSVLTRAVFNDRQPYHFFGWEHLRLLSHYLGMDAEQMLMEHSMFPFITSRLSDAERQRHFETALVTSSERRQTPLNRGSGLASRRWCIECTKQDVEAYGDSHWRRSHNVPGVLICPVHRTPLVTSDEWGHQPTFNSNYDLPHHVVECRPVLERTTPFVQQLADVALRWVADPGKEQAERGREWIAKRAAELGFRSKRQFLLLELVEFLRGCLGQAAQVIFPDELETALMRTARISRPALRVNSPIKYAILQAALELPPNETREFLPHNVQTKGSSPLDPSRAAIAKDIIDRCIANQTRIKLKEVIAACGKRGLANDGRYPQLEAQLDRLRRSGLTARRRPDELDAERAAIAKRFIDERIKAGIRTTKLDVAALCGLRDITKALKTPLLLAQVARLRTSKTRPTRWNKPAGQAGELATGSAAGRRPTHP
jgi:hypothetical protein